MGPPTASCASTRPVRQSIKVAEGSISSAIVSVTPEPAAAAKFTLVGLDQLCSPWPRSVNLTITAQDLYGNTATDYVGRTN